MRAKKMVRKFTTVLSILLLAGFLAACSNGSSGGGGGGNSGGNGENGGNGGQSSSAIVASKNYAVYLADGTLYANGISGTQFQNYANAAGLTKGTDYTVDNENNKITLTDTGYAKIVNFIKQGGGGSGGGSSSSFAITEKTAPSPALFADSEVPNDWTYNDRGTLLLQFSVGDWAYLHSSDWTSTIEQVYATYMITSSPGTIDCSSAKEVVLIPLTDSQISELKGSDAEDELGYIISSKGKSSFNEDNVYLDTNAKILVLEKTVTATRLNTDKGRDNPLPFLSAKAIKVDDVDNPTKYKVVFDDDGKRCAYYAKITNP